MEIIAAVCNRYGLRINNLDIGIANNRFNVSLSLSPLDTLNYNDIALANERRYIPMVFGYEWEIPLFEPVITESGEQPEPVIGYIRDSSGRRVFFRDNIEGRIQVRIDNE